MLFRSFDAKLEERRATLDATQLAVGPGPAVALLKQVIQKNPDDEIVVHVISDFRETDWENPIAIRDTLVDLQRAGAELHFVSCVSAAQPNLAVTKIEPSDDTRAAGVPLFCNVEIKNFGATAARRVQLKVRSYFYDPEQIAAGEVDRAVGEAEDLPAAIIDEIPAGKTETRRVAVFFPKPGKHVVEASLVDDALNGDNRRWCVVDVPPTQPINVKCKTSPCVDLLS